MVNLDLKNIDIVSFDIFDTLIYRNVEQPSDVFELVELKYNSKAKNKINNFKKNRMEAEHYCRVSSNYEEITLDDIYNRLINYYPLSTVNKLKELEYEIEEIICIPNMEIKEIYDEIKNKKDIIIISDIYLDRKFIEKILHKCGYNNYKNLFISSQIKKTKYKGDIFEYVSSQMKIEPSKIIHIGDNKKSDYINPQKYGYKTYLYNNKNNYNSTNNKIISGLLKNNKNKEYFYSFGYNNLGPLLFGFIKWLKNNLNSKKVYFLARDGFIMKKAFDMYTNNEYESNYFYASRRALLVPSFHNCNCLNDVLEVIEFDRTYKKLKKRLGIEDLNLENIEKKYNINNNTKITKENLYNNSNIRKFLEEIFPQIINNSKKEYDNFKKYTNNCNFKNNVNIVDIGWYGNMQKAITKCIDDINISGYYFGLFPHGKIQNNNNMKGYLFDKNHGKQIYEIEITINCIIELLFTAPHGSVKKYNINNENNVELYEFEFLNKDSYHKIESLQKGAIDFINNYIIYDKYFDLELSSDENFKPLFSLAKNPTKEDIINWGDFIFYDNGENYIAKPQNKVYYILHPKKFFSDYKQSLWKMGFLKRSFPLLAKLYKIYKFK